MTLLLLALLALAWAPAPGLSSTQVTSCPHVYDLTLQYTIDDVVDSIFLPLDPDRNTLDYRTRAYAFFKEQYGIELDPAEAGPQQPPGFAHIPFAFSRGIRMSVYAIDAQNHAPWRGRFPINNAEFLDDGYQLVAQEEVTVHGRFGGADGTVIPKGSLLLYGEYRLIIDGEYQHTFVYRSSVPVTVAPVSNLGVINCDIQSDVWGDGITRGVFEISPTEDGRQQAHFRYTMTFPKHQKDKRVGETTCVNISALAPDAASCSWS